eukprot:COSAG01_NODE_5108_length_4476_cov_14.006854_1_plen_85_part_00
MLSVPNICWLTAPANTNVYDSAPADEKWICQIERRGFAHLIVVPKAFTRVCRNGYTVTAVIRTPKQLLRPRCTRAPVLRFIVNL